MWNRLWHNYKLKLFDLFIVRYIFFRKLKICDKICGAHVFVHILNKCGRFCVGFATRTKGFLSPVSALRRLDRYWNTGFKFCIMIWPISSSIPKSLRKASGLWRCQTGTQAIYLGSLWEAADDLHRCIVICTSGSDHWLDLRTVIIKGRISRHSVIKAVLQYFDT